MACPSHCNILSFTVEIHALTCNKRTSQTVFLIDKMSRYVFICVVQCVWSCWARPCSCMMIRRTEMLSWLVSRCRIMMASHGYRRKAPHATISWEFCSLNFKILCVYVMRRGVSFCFGKLSGLMSSARHTCSCVFALTGSSILSPHVTCWPRLHWTVFIFTAALSLHLSWMCMTSSFATGRPQIIQTWLTLAFPCCVSRAFKAPTWIVGPNKHIYGRNVCYFLSLHLVQCVCQIETWQQNLPK